MNKRTKMLQSFCAVFKLQSRTCSSQEMSTTRDPQPQASGDAHHPSSLWAVSRPLSPASCYPLRPGDNAANLEETAHIHDYYLNLFSQVHLKVPSECCFFTTQQILQAPDKAIPRSCKTLKCVYTTQNALTVLYHPSISSAILHAGI